VPPRRHALGTGHRRGDSKVNCSSVTASPSVAASAAAIAEQAMAGFHPSPVSAALACVRRIAVSRLRTAPTWAPVLLFKSAAGFKHAFATTVAMSATLGASALATDFHHQPFMAGP